MTKESVEMLMVFPSGGAVFYSNFKYHLGAAYIIAYLRQHGFSAEQFISNESLNVKECVSKIVKYNPKIVGFTVYESNYMQCVLISNGLKSYDSEIIIIFGGPTPTIQSKEILESIKTIDLCVRQEGEETLLELFYVLSKNDFNLNKSDLYEIKGITFKNENGIVINPDSDTLFSNRFSKNYLDKYPSPYLSNVIPKSKAVPIGVVTARGCNQNCIYCNCAVLSKRNIYFHSIERVIEELTYLSGIKKFLGPLPIWDDAFTLIPSRAKKICETIIENNIKIPLLCTTRCDKINEELLDLMKQAGFQSVGFSLESAVPRVLRAIGKVSSQNIVNSDNFDKEIEFIKRFKSMTSYAKKIGIKRVFASMMVGLPNESFRDAQKTIKLINKLDIDVYTHNNLHIFKGTPIYQNHKRYGYKVEPISQRNQIFIDNNFPFDVYKLKIGEKCSKIKKSQSLDYKSFKILSLNLKRTTQKSFFDNIIINSNLIKSSLVKWMQENLAINGVIIQLYSSKNAFLRLKDKNKTILYDNFAPTCYYECYYKEKLGGHYYFKSGRTALYGDYIGFPLKLDNTYSGLKNYNNGKDEVEFIICQDNEIRDTKALLDFLAEISGREDPVNYVLKRNFLPQFQSLCRWTDNNANCQTLETAIIGSDDSIRICWQSDSLGEIGTSALDIKRNLLNLKKEIRKTRICNRCQENATCSKCLFPFPLSSEEYCYYKKVNDTTEATEIVNVFNIMKDLIYEPIDLVDI